MKKIIKRFFILFLCLTLSISSFSKQRANAVALVDDLVVGGGITVSTGAIVALAGTTLVAGGVYLDSTLNDSNVSRYVVSKMIDTGNALNYWGSKTLESGKQVLTWTSEGLKEFYDVLSSTIESGVPYENVSGVSGDTIDFVKPGTYTIVYTYDFTFGDYGLQTETKVMSNTGGISIFSTSNSINVKDYLSNRVYIGLSGGITNLVVSSVLLDGNSVCVDVSESHRNFNDSICTDRVSSTSTSPDNSISYQPSIGVPLNPPLDGSVGALNPSIDFPYGKTWDDLYPDVSIPKDTDTGTDVPDIDVPSDTVFDKVIDSIKDLTDSIADSIDKIFDMPVGDTPSLDFSPLMIATMKFPFCIPWDLFRCVEVFNSGEETFKYEFKEVKYSDTDIIIIPNFKVDFSTIPYVDTLRKVFKFIMYISYCVFLICKIRGLMRS